MNNGLSLWLLVFLTACATPFGSSADKIAETVLVLVSDGETGDQIEDARVFVLAADGGELVTLRTDRYGQAHIPVRVGAAGARYVLVERAPYYISGLPWHDGTPEYYIQMTLQHLR